MTERINPGNYRDLGLPAWLLTIIAGHVAGTNSPNLFRVLGKHRTLFRGWLHFAGRLMPGGLLSRKETELVILRIAFQRNSHYELEHHKRLGKRAGLTAEQIERVTNDPETHDWPEREQCLLETADTLLNKHDLDDTEWQHLREQLSEREAIELCMLVGHYDMLATTINVLRIEPDSPRR